MKRVTFLIALLALLSLAASCWPQDRVNVGPVRIKISSPQRASFVGEIALVPDTLSAFDRRSVFLKHVPDGLRSVDIELEMSAATAEITCQSVRFADGFSGTYTATENQGDRVKKVYHLEMAPPPAREFYAANLLIRFCGLQGQSLGPDYSKRTYYLGFWYGPEEVLVERARGIKALTLDELELSQR